MVDPEGITVRDHIDENENFHFEIIIPKRAIVSTIRNGEHMFDMFRELFFKHLDKKYQKTLL